MSLKEVKLYDKNETDFSHNGLVLYDFLDEPIINRVINGRFMLSGVYDINGQFVDKIKDKCIFKAWCPNRTWQLFRLNQITSKTPTSISFTANHIAFDGNRNFVEDMFVADGTVDTIMREIENSLTFKQRFRYRSNMPGKHQFTIKRNYPIDAIIGSNNNAQNLASVCGGELEMDNFDLIMRERLGEDKGFPIDMGLNLDSIEETIPDLECPNSLYLIGGTEASDYDDPGRGEVVAAYVETTDFKVTDENRVIGRYTNSECKTKEELVEWAKKDLFGKQQVHIPKVSHKVNIVDLASTDEYKEYKDLFTLQLGDSIRGKLQKVDMEISERMIEYNFYTRLAMYKDMILGNDPGMYTRSTKEVIQSTLKKIDTTRDFLHQDLVNATEIITGNDGGYVVQWPKNRPSDILIMDTNDVSTAKKVLRMNKSGIGFSTSGWNGPFDTAWTIDGTFNANYIGAGKIRADIFETSFNNYGDQLKLSNGALQAYNGSKKIMELTKRGLEFWSGDKSIGTMGTAGEPFPKLQDEDGPVSMDGKALIIRTDANGEYIAFAATEGKGIILGKNKGMYLIEDNIQVIGKITLSGDMNVVGSISINGQKVIPGQNGGPGPGEGGSLSDVFVRVLALTAKYEMGDRGSGYYHPPLDDGAGWNYGKYSFTQVYEMDNFLAWLAKYYPDARSALVGSVGSNEFNNSWAAYGNANDKQFTRMQAEYFCRTKLKPAIEGLKSSTGVDFNDGQKWLGTLGILASIQNWYPAAVSTGFFKTITQQFANRWDDAAFITTVCDYIVANAASMVAPAYVEGIQNRFRNEKADALKLTDKTYIPFDGVTTNRGLEHLENLLGRRVGNGQCYGLTAEYSGYMGGCGLGAGTQYGMSHLTGIGSTAAASDIGIAYDWPAVGWTVIKNPTYAQLQVGAIINITRGALWANWPTVDDTYGHTGVIRGLENGRIQTYEQNTEQGMIVGKFDRAYTSPSGISSIVIPPIQK